MDLFIGILASLAAVGILSIAKWIYNKVKTIRRFLPYKAIWKEFTSNDTLIVLTGREYGHTTKISFNEAISANRILGLLNLPSRKNVNRINAANGDFSIFKDKNIIVLGSERINQVSKEIMKHISMYVNYSYTAENNLVINNEIFKSVYKNNVLIKDYGLVVKTQNPIDSKKSTILFAGNHGLGTQAAVQAMTEKSETEQIVKEIGNSHFFAVIESHFDKRFSEKPINLKVVRCSLLEKDNFEKQISPASSRENEIKVLMSKLGANEQIVNHSIEVARLSMELSRAIESRGKDLDMDAIYYGACLHDIGRIKSNGINHGIEGVKLILSIKEEFIKNQYLTNDTFNKIIESIECHIVGGIKENWITAHSLNLPIKDYTPKSIEAKIVTLCDQILHNRRKGDIIFREAPEKDYEILASLYKSSEEIFQLLFYDRN
ncbi:HD domain-containing protein [bacterium]|nr:MAG: HD domain-containing protein [bacterium]